MMFDELFILYNIIFRLKFLSNEMLWILNRWKGKFIFIWIIFLVVKSLSFRSLEIYDELYKDRRVWMMFFE